MLNKPLLSDETVQSLYDMMIWLSTAYGSPVKQTVPKVLNPEVPCHQRLWQDDDPRIVFDWARSEMKYLSQLCKMEDWSVQVAPDGYRAQLQSLTPNTAPEDIHDPSLTPLISRAWRENKYPEYVVDNYGRPTFYYDPSRCVEAGYFTKTVLPQFALLKIYAKHPPSEFVESSIGRLVQMTVCHMGVGFNLLALMQAKNSQNWTPKAMLSLNQADNVELSYLYGTLISLAAHRLTREQIIATYGKLMTQRTRRLLNVAHEQLESYKDSLKLLRLLSQPIRSAHPEHNHLHQARVSNGPV